MTCARGSLRTGRALRGGGGERTAERGGSAEEEEDVLTGPRVLRAAPLSTDSGLRPALEAAVCDNSSEDLLPVSFSSHGALRTFSRSPPDFTELSLKTYSRLHLISRSSEDLLPSSEDLLSVSSSSHGALRTFSRSPPDLTELSLRTYSRVTTRVHRHFTTRLQDYMSGDQVVGAPGVPLQYSFSTPRGTQSSI
ncbi:unnamed protein product [Arctogadus glacialis]